eukprot:5738216-Prymnesium_polylepis.3
MSVEVEPTRAFATSVVSASLFLSMKLWTSTRRATFGARAPAWAAGGGGGAAARRRRARDTADRSTWACGTPRRAAQKGRSACPAAARGCHGCPSTQPASIAGPPSGKAPAPLQRCGR